MARRPSLQLAANLLRYGLSLAALLWLAHNVTWSDFAALAQLDPAVIAGAALLSGSTYPLQAWRWQLLLRTQGLAPPTLAVHRAFWIGLFYNSFLPGGIAGDAVRFAWLWRIAPDRKAASAASLIIDRLLGFGTLLALAGCGLGAHLAARGGGPQLQSLWLLTVAAFLVLLLGWWCGTRGHWWEKLLGRVVGTSRAATFRSLSQSFQLSSAALALPVVLSLAIWLLDFTALWLLAQAVGLSVSLFAIASAAAAAYVAAALPISVGGHGVRETTLIAILALFGVADETNAALTTLALVFWAVTVGWALFGGLVCLVSLLRRSPPDSSRATTAEKVR